MSATRDLRNAMGRFATGVAVVTASTPGHPPIGMTINSFSSVSLEPPLVLFSIDKKAHSLTRFREAEDFAINVLAGHQRELSARFTRPLSANWDDIELRKGSGGAPLLSGAVAWFECVPWAAYDGGDHLIFVCRVVGFTLREDGEPLVFFAGRYGGFNWARPAEQGHGEHDQERR